MPAPIRGPPLRIPFRCRALPLLGAECARRIHSSGAPRRQIARRHRNRAGDHERERERDGIARRHAVQHPAHQPREQQRDDGPDREPRGCLPQPVARALRPFRARRARASCRADGSRPASRSRGRRAARDASAGQGRAEARSPAHREDRRRRECESESRGHWHEGGHWRQRSRTALTARDCRRLACPYDSMRPRLATAR